MKRVLFLVMVMLAGLNGFAQKIDYSLDDGYIAEGYDVTEYFNGKAVEGKSSYTTTLDGVKFKFASQNNLNKFKTNPAKYTPQYGGYCAYAMATRKKKVDPDPESFKIQDGQLLLFYASWRTNTRDKWNDEGPAKLKPKADANWEEVKHKG